MEAFVAVGVSLGLGLLIGLQRQRADSRVGGIRTFPLISLLGTICGLLTLRYGAWVMLGGFLTVFGVLAISNFMRIRSEGTEPGQTTEVAALLTFALGAYLVEGDRSLALLATGIVVVLLHLKQPMHRFVETMGDKDMRAVMQFVVISLIIFPLLPDTAYGPYKVLNPFDIWRMVVLIVGISLTAYIIYKIVGQKTGTVLGGILGGMISSTATTVSYARRSRSARGAESQAAFVIMVASAIAFVRVMIEIAAVAPGYLGAMVLPLGLMFLWMTAISIALFLWNRDASEEIPQPENPAELKSALFFGAVYAVILFAVGAVKHHFGSSALYVVAIISGLTDMDAITLSLARMTEAGRLDPSPAWRLILAAALSNLVFKGLAVAFLGSRRLTGWIAILFAVSIAGGLGLIFFWPEDWTLTGFLPETTGTTPAEK